MVDVGLLVGKHNGEDFVGKSEGNPPKKTSAPKAPAFSPTVVSPYLSRVAYLYPKESKTILIKNFVCLLLET
jgi:hypothetical protein